MSTQTSEEPKQKHMVQVDHAHYEALLKIATAASLFCEEATDGVLSHRAETAFNDLNKALDEFDAL